MLSASEHNVMSVKETSRFVYSKTTQITLKKEDGNFGFIVRGERRSGSDKCRCFVISYIRPGGPSDREGTIKVGDRLLEINDISLENATLEETITILKKVERNVRLIIEYDVSMINAICNASGPLLVEIEKTPGSQLGISLTTLHWKENTVIIESVKEGSTAERCGALHVGDHILAIDGTSVTEMTLDEVSLLLKDSVGQITKLKICPISHGAYCDTYESCLKKGKLHPLILKSLNVNSNEDYCHLCGKQLFTFPMHQFSQWNKMQRDRCTSLCCTPFNSMTIEASSTSDMYYVDTTEVTIPNSIRGYGFHIQTSLNAGMNPRLVICTIEHGGPAEKTGLLQVGDRILAVNGHTTQGLEIEEVYNMIQQSQQFVVLKVEFDVAESVVPSSGTFTVKLAKQQGSLGITITAPKNRELGEPLILSDIKKGSVAHRSGTLQPGDKLLAINTIRMDYCTLEDAAQILIECKDVVKLRIRKDDVFSEEPDNGTSVVYTVELVRHGGSLGITLSGTEEPFEPIVISGLMKGGLCEKTGALHVGDKLLAINGQSLRGKTLSQAIMLLQNSGDIVTLKVSKYVEQTEDKKVIKEELPTNNNEQDDIYIKHGRALPSVDSAVDSWDGSALEIFHRRPNWDHTNTEIPGDEPFDSTEDKCYSLANYKIENKWQSDSNISDTLNKFKSLSQFDLSIQSSHRKLSESDPSLVTNLFYDHSSSSFRTVIYRENRTLSEENLSDTDLRSSRSKIFQQFHSSTFPHRSSNQPYQESITYSTSVELYEITLYKDNLYDDFGFSVSDGLFERGVFVNRIRPGGPADVGGHLRPYDKILQVNGTETANFDCCLTVPLIATAGEQIKLVISRSSFIPVENNSDNNWPDQNRPNYSLQCNSFTKTL